MDREVFRIQVFATILRGFDGIFLIKTQFHRAEPIFELPLWCLDSFIVILSWTLNFLRLREPFLLLKIRKSHLLMQFWLFFSFLFRKTPPNSIPIPKTHPFEKQKIAKCSYLKNVNRNLMSETMFYSFTPHN